MCSMAYELARAMSHGNSVTVKTTQGDATDRVTRRDREVQEIADAQVEYTVGGRPVHIASVKEITHHV